MMKRRGVSLLIGLFFVLLSTIAVAQDAPEAQSEINANSIDQILEDVEKGKTPEVLTEEEVNPEPVPEELIEDTPPVLSVEDQAPVVAKQEPQPIAPGVYGHVHPRAAIGLLGSDLAADVGIMLEASGKYLGIFARGGGYMPTNHDIEYAFDFGIGFHIYPFGTAPGGFYFGPALSILHFCYDPGPFVGIPTVTADQADDYTIREIMGMSDERNMPRQYDLVVPMVDVGYKHWFDFGLTLGIEASAGYARSDQKDQHPSEFYVMATPVIGYGW